MTRIFTILFLMIFICELSLAQWTNDVTVNTQVSDFSGSEQGLPHSVTTSDGSTYVSWFDNSNGSYQFRMQLFDPKGYKLWGNDGILVSDKPQGTALYKCDLKIDSKDNAIAAFQDERTGTLQVVAYKIDKNGNQLWGNDGIELQDSSSFEGLGPTIGVLGNDDVIIAWNASNGANKWIAFEKVTEAGVVQWDSLHTIIDISITKKYSRPSIIAKGSDGFYILYAEEGGGFGLPPSHLYTQLYHSDGTEVWQAPLLVYTNLIPFFFFPEPVSDKNGGYYIAFNTGNPDNNSLNDVFVQKVTEAGLPWGVAGKQACNSSTNQKTISGSVYIADKDEFWVLVRMQDAGQSESGIHVQALKSDGTLKFPATGVEILPYANNFYIPESIGNTNDGLVIIYTESTVTEDVIKALKLNNQAVPVWSPVTLPLAVSPSAKFNISLGDFVNNQAVIVWQDDRLDYGIYAQNIRSEGTTSSSESTIPGIELSLYPNPSLHPNLYFNLLKQEELSISIYSISGNLLYKDEKTFNEGLNSLSIENKELLHGTYLVEIVSKHGKQTLKWIKAD